MNKQNVFKKKLIVGLMAIASSFSYQANAEVVTGQTAMEIVKIIGTGWNLGNTLDATGGNGLNAETSWGMPKTTQEMIDEVKKAGFNFVRIPVSWSKHTSNNGVYTYAIDPQWMARVHEIADYCFHNDMFVILNIHHDNNTNYLFPSEEYKEQSITYLRDIWTQVATEFAEYDQHLIFETMNEPRLAEINHKNEWNFTFNDPEPDVAEAIGLINQFNQVAVEAIRGVNKGYNKDRCIMVPGYVASIDGLRTPEFKMPTDEVSDRLIISVHAYTPYNFCMNTTTSDKFSKMYQNDVDWLFNTLNQMFVSKGQAVIIGETSASNRQNTEERVKWFSYFYKKSKDFTIPCALWDNNRLGTKPNAENHGYLNRRKLEWYQPEIIDALMVALGIRNGVEDISADDPSIQIYPTLANETVQISTDGEIITNVKIITIDGKTAKDIVGISNQLSVDVRDLETGQYIIKAQTATKAKTLPIIVK